MNKTHRAKEFSSVFSSSCRRSSDGIDAFWISILVDQAILKNSLFTSSVSSAVPSELSFLRSRDAVSCPRESQIGGIESVQSALTARSERRDGLRIRWRGLQNLPSEVLRNLLR